MKNRLFDWKDIAQSYYEKSLSLAILILLFSFLVFPKLEIKPFRREIKASEVIELPPEIRERIKPPEDVVRPVIEIVIDEDFSADEDDDIEIVATIEKTVLDPYEEKEVPKNFGTTSRFQVFEDPPVPIRQVKPVYSDFAKKSGIEGEVMLEVEVFADGSVGQINVIKSLMSGPGGLDEAAKAAVRKWEFSPAKSNGKPVSVWVVFPVGFSLN
ncbi:MAG: energy transducer TonB [Candidatus Cloacimonetes bacterium]|nr:energy transducer TonB [Candidatus Cloacimonadota bacterium]